jgi:hypothetical protein
MSMSNSRAHVGLLVRLTAVVVLLSPGCSLRSQSVQPFISSCQADAEIPPKDLGAIDAVAIDFLQNALGPNPENAYSSFTAEAKESVNSDRFVVMFKQGIQPNGPYKNLHAAHTYLARVTGGIQDQRVICGSLSTPETWVAVNIRPGPAQAHVIVEAQTLNNTWAFVTWLRPEQGIWPVQYTQATVTAIVGKSAEDLRSMADSEIREHHNFNAFLLYAAAVQLASRGPFLQLGIQPELQKALGDLKPPPQLQGQPPFYWQLGKSSYRVLNVGPIGISQKVYLKIDHEIAPWADDKEADTKNRELIATFSSTYPEYKQAFAGLIITAHERGGNRGFGTVIENDATAK